jgi:hypothetical protein
VKKCEYKFALIEVLPNICVIINHRKDRNGGEDGGEKV